MTERLFTSVVVYCILCARNRLKEVPRYYSMSYTALTLACICKDCFNVNNCEHIQQFDRQICWLNELRCDHSNGVIDMSQD